MDIDAHRTAHFHVTVRWRLGDEERDPVPADIQELLAEGLAERIGLRDLMEIDVRRIPAEA